jgi:hypothetical protein
MNKLNSNDLLSFDFLHDNPNQLRFFDKNEMYNLNTFENFCIKKELLNTNIQENIEQYVSNIIFKDFEHMNGNIKTNYNNTIEEHNIKYDKKYILVFDNMQCTIKNILNIKMLLMEPIIQIHILLKILTLDC